MIIKTGEGEGAVSGSHFKAEVVFSQGDSVRSVRVFVIMDCSGVDVLCKFETPSGHLLYFIKINFCYCFK